MRMITTYSKGRPFIMRLQQLTSGYRQTESYDEKDLPDILLNGGTGAYTDGLCPDILKSQVLAEIFPLFLLLREETQEVRIIAEMIEIGIVLEQGIAREAIVRRHP